MSFTITRKQLTDLKCCQAGLDWFNLKSGGQDTLTYPNGFGPTDIQRVAREQPRFLKWMAKFKIVPITLNEARLAVAEVHGLDPGFIARDSWRTD